MRHTLLLAAAVFAAQSAFASLFETDPDKIVAGLRQSALSPSA